MMMEVIQEQAINLLATIVTVILGIVANKVTKFLKEKGVVATLLAKEASVSIAVDAIEQIARNEQVPDKFKAAKKRAVELLNAQGISITDEELGTLIESAVAEINKNVAEVVNNE